MLDLPLTESHREAGSPFKIICKLTPAANDVDLLGHTNDYTHRVDRYLLGVAAVRL